MRYLFLSPPATGEMQPALAVASAMLDKDSQAKIYIASGSSFQARFERFTRILNPSAATRIFCLDLGHTDDVEDYSQHMLHRHSDRLPHLFGTHRHARGNPIPFFNYWQAFAAGTEEQRLITIQRILRIIDTIRPDMIVVDQIYGTPFDGELSFLFVFFLSLSLSRSMCLRPDPAMALLLSEQKLTMTSVPPNFLLSHWSISCCICLLGDKQSSRSFFSRSIFKIAIYRSRTWSPKFRSWQVPFSLSCPTKISDRRFCSFPQVMNCRAQKQELRLISSDRIAFVLAEKNSPLLTDVNPIREPLSMSGIQWKNSLWNIRDNFRLVIKLVTWVAGSQWAWTTLKLRRWVSSVILLFAGRSADSNYRMSFLFIPVPVYVHTHRHSALDGCPSVQTR